MRTRTAFSFLVLAVATTACGAGSDTADTGGEPAVEAVATVPVTGELLSEGRRAYRKFCVQCHGFSGKGDGTSAAHLTPPPRDHTDVALMDPISDLGIAEAVRFGGVGRGFPNMPAFPQVPVDELIAMVAYVRSLSRPDAASVDIRGIR